MSCRACGDDAVCRSHTAREQMFGFGGAFQYDECARCGSLTLVNVPDLASYYPDIYYSISKPTTTAAKLLARVREFRTAGAFLAIAKTFGVAVWPETKILDIGSGSGTMLRGLSRRGIRYLVGSDPFLPREIARPVRLTREHVLDLNERFDVVTFNHALEHVSDPRRELAAALSVTSGAQRGAVIVRIPIVADAWERYGVHWVGLDAPRHLLLATERGMRDLTARAGGRIERICYDSSAYQFWASEIFVRGRTLDAAIGTPLRSACSFALGELRYGRAARRLNRQRRGDAAAFLIRPAV